MTQASVVHNVFAISTCSDDTLDDACMLHREALPHFASFCSCAVGASYFYQPGGVSYEAQEVRAFGLLLKDLVSRIKLELVDDQPDQDSYDVLQHVLSLCTESNTLARQRPTFSQLYAKLKQ